MQWKWTAALALVAATSPALAAPPLEPAADRPTVETRLKGVEARLARLRAARTAAPATDLDAAGRWIEVARELLKLDNAAAAGVVVHHAARLVDPPKGAPDAAVQR